jgi:hypothetical protein
MAPRADSSFRNSTAFILASLVAGTWLLACSSSLDSAVQARAADDFECTADSVRVEEVGRSRYHARGCGKDGDYICSSTPDGVDCSLDSDLDVETPSTLTTAPAASSSGP